MNYWVWNRVDGASDKEIGTLVPIKEAWESGECSVPEAYQEKFRVILTLF